MRLEDYEASFNAAKEKYHEIMKAENDAAVLLKWMIEEDINPWEIFHDPAFASLTSNLEGLIGLYQTLNHALYDDGDVTFIKTEGTSPKIMFLWRNEKNFLDIYNRNVQQGVEHIFEITGYLDNVQEFIKEYEERERVRKEMFEEIDEQIRKMR